MIPHLPRLAWLTLASQISREHTVESLASCRLKRIKTAAGCPKGERSESMRRYSGAFARSLAHGKLQRAGALQNAVARQEAQRPRESGASWSACGKPRRDAAFAGGTACWGRTAFDYPAKALLLAQAG